LWKLFHARSLPDKIMAFIMKSTLIQWYLNSNSHIARFCYRGLLNQLKTQIKRRNTIREIKEISEILYHYGCVWSLQSANVLGIQRNGKLRANEDDVDIAVLAETWQAKVEEAIRQKGFNLSVYCGGYYEGSEGVHYVATKQGLVFDIYPSFKDKLDNITYRWYGGDHPNRYYFEPRLLEQTRTVKFYGFDVEIPSDTDGYLRAIYGEDYIIPNDNWDWRTMPKCRLQLKPTYLSQADVERYQIGES